MMPWFGPSIATRRRTRCPLVRRLHPCAGKCHAEAVPDDVDTLGPGVVEHGADEAIEIEHVRERRVRKARADRLIREQIALVALVAEPPELRRRVPVISE